MKLVAINCTLKRGDAASSTDKMIDLIAGHFGEYGVQLAERLRIANFNVLPGVKSDEGEGDDWPGLREKILDADIFLFATPIWLGQPSSIAKRVLERMDAFLGETDDRGRTPAFGKVAVVAVVGNEDGAHRVTSDVYQALGDVGWTIPAQVSCYWVGEAMHGTDFKDLPKVPDVVDKTARMLAANAAHLAKLLKQAPYPGIAQSGK